MKEIWIVYNGNYITEDVLWHIQRFTDAFQQRGYRVKALPTTSIVTLLDKAASVWGAGQPPEKILFWDKDILLAQTLEQLGAQLFNNRICIARCDNKSLCYQELVKQGLPIPKTILAPKIYSTARDFEIYQKIGAMLRYPLVVKESYGSFGTGVYLVHTESELLELVQKLGNKDYLMQEYIEASCGEDIRVIVIGGKVITAVKRKNTEDFRANVARGGSMEPYILSEEEAEIAVRAAEAMNADFSGVDLLRGAKGEVYVCEVNSNMHFKACMEVTGEDIAGSIAQLIDSAESSNKSKKCI